MTTINWLHLTDFHCDAPGQVWLQEAVKDAFFADLTSLSRVCGPWDLVFFTGDLAYSGCEYSNVHLLFDKLWDKFHDLGCDPILFAVPGNHDLQRPTTDMVKYLRKMRPSDNKSEFVRALAAPFQNYKEWSEENKKRGSGVITCSKQRVEVSELLVGQLPGDFAATIVKNGLHIGVMGLNTAFWDINETGKGDLLDDQLQFIPKQVTNWASEHNAAFLLTHHPPEDMSGTSREHLETIVDPAGTFTAHLYGHMHDPVIEEMKIAGSPTRRMLGGASMFGLPKKNEGDSRNSRNRIHGYTAGRLDIPDDDPAKLQIWPRCLIRRADGRFKMIGDFKWDLDQSERIEFCISLTTKPTPPPGTQESKDILRLLKQAFDQNHEIPSNVVADGFFTQEALRSIDDAWEQATVLPRQDIAKRVALLERCKADRFRGQWSQAKDALEVAYQGMGAMAPDNDVDAQMLIVLAAIKSPLTNPFEAAELCEKVLYYLRQRNAPWLLAIANRLQCSIRRGQSEFRAARQHGYAALEIARHLISVGAGVVCLSQPGFSPLSLISRQVLLADCLRECGKLEEMEMQQERAKELFKEAELILGELETVDAARYLLAVTRYEHVIVDKTTDVEDIFEQNKKILMEFSNPVRLSCLLRAYGREMLKAEHHEKASELFKEEQEKRKDLNLSFLEAHTNLSLGQLEIDNGKFTKAIKLLIKSVSTFDLLGKRYYCAEAQYLLGLALEKDENFIESKTRFEAAVRIFDELGLRDWVERCIEHLR